MNNAPTVTLMYHFFFPDDVVSARHFTQLAESLRDLGWKVRVLTSNRYCRYTKKTIHPRKEMWNNIEIIRAYRPSFNQANNYGRIFNSIFILNMWLLHLLMGRKSDVIIVGTDPQFAALIFPFLKIFRRGKILVHWCFDVYPEAVIANETGKMTHTIMRIAKRFMSLSYKFVDVMVDIGQCMRSILQRYKHKALYHTLTPWALVEPDTLQKPNEKTRVQLFGENAKLTILYSGNMGKAHDFQQIVDLARYLCKDHKDIVFCFACRGNRYEELVSQVTAQDTNIRFAGFADEAQLAKRLGCADIHLVSLKEQWSGIVVPSKFFGSIAMGKPIIFNGPQNSAIAKWISQYKIGWLLNNHNIPQIATELIKLKNEPQTIQQCSQKAHQVYKEHFSRKSVVRRWDQLLRSKIK
ncbi:glycosyltransferase family 4 protein [Candidatus Uabimicrobium amorphum]|uniref:Glycosyltransferase WbuB n=1 Tax=Uabimicrobium amorphum TaxID=2596890 RepID=A0A5S9IN93_UABAM|nr:glycosyltransferase family 4 protein [Candidatus Uabimicrobium amorphum]BBM84180.1 glycosyltransferase WbuB [Candidatus Uabimicrobium amorphum]